LNSDRLGLKIGHCSDAGQQRDLNEDSYLVLTDPTDGAEIDGVFVVADGMGGHQAGDVASQALVETMDEIFSSSSAHHQGVAYSQQHPDYYVVLLKELLEQINEQIYDLSISQPGLNGMGTTATVALIKGARLFWGHVGDSRAYLLHDGDLRQLTQDHTWVAEQVAAGQMSMEEAAQHPRRHVLTQSLGNNLVIRVGRGVENIQVGDTLLLCSDGLTSMVRETEIRETLLAQVDPQITCEHLVTLANRRGGPDNITALVVKLTGGDKENNPPLELIGPVQPQKSKRSQADTLKLRPRRGERIDQLKKTFRHFALILLPLSGALFSGLLGLALSKRSFSIGIPVTAIVAMLTFVLGFLVSRLAQTLGRDQNQIEVQNKG
jgi:serine/threonine protein phosphatase PrpC